MRLPEEVLAPYRAALEGLAVAARSERRFLEVRGKAPRDMLKGIVSGTLPDPPDPASAAGSETAESLLESGRDTPGTLSDSREDTPLRVIRSRDWEGRVGYSAILTPKGRMITDLRILAIEDGAFLLDLPTEGVEGARAHFQKTLPPRLARVEDRTENWGRVTVSGPDAIPSLEGTMTAICGGASVSLFGLPGLAEGEALNLLGDPAGAIWITPDSDLNPPSWDVVGPASIVARLVARLEENGATRMPPPVLDLLRLERGRPRFGADMNEQTIPVEAGIHQRAIDYEKGCYTGQEVIIRIRDRGRANKHLRGYLLGDTPVPSPGTELYPREGGRKVGWITSAAYSPSFRETIALGYAMRGVEPGDELRLSGPEGPVARVRALDHHGWVLDVPADLTLPGAP